MVSLVRFHTCPIPHGWEQTPQSKSWPRAEGGVGGVKDTALGVPSHLPLTLRPSPKDLAPVSLSFPICTMGATHLLGLV